MYIKENRYCQTQPKTTVNVEQPVCQVLNDGLQKYWKLSHKYANLACSFKVRLPFLCFKSDDLVPKAGRCLKPLFSSFKKLLEDGMECFAHLVLFQKKFTKQLDFLKSSP